MQDPASAANLDSLLAAAAKYLGSGGIVVLATIVVLKKLGLLGNKNGNGEAEPPRPTPHNSLAEQITKGSTGDWTAAGHILKELGELQGELNALKERQERHAEAIRELRATTTEINVRLKDVAPNTAKMVMLGLRKAGLIPDRPVFSGGELPDEDKLKNTEL